MQSLWARVQMFILIVNQERRSNKRGFWLLIWFPFYKEVIKWIFSFPLFFSNHASVLMSSLSSQGTWTSAKATTSVYLETGNQQLTTYVSSKALYMVCYAYHTHICLMILHVVKFPLSDESLSLFFMFPWKMITLSPIG